MPNFNKRYVVGARQHNYPRGNASAWYNASTGTWSSSYRDATIYNDYPDVKRIQIPDSAAALEVYEYSSTGYPIFAAPPVLGELAYAADQPGELHYAIARQYVSGFKYLSHRVAREPLSPDGYSWEVLDYAIFFATSKSAVAFIERYLAGLGTPVAFLYSEGKYQKHPEG